MPAALICVAQLPRSSRMNCTNCSGVLRTSWNVLVANTLRASGETRALAASALILSATGGGQPAGPNRPHQPPVEKPGTADSAMVGRSGCVGILSAPAAAMIRRVPALTWASTLLKLTISTATSLRNSAVIAGVAPLYG